MLILAQCQSLAIAITGTAALEISTIETAREKSGFAKQLRDFDSRIDPAPA